MEDTKTYRIIDKVFTFDIIYTENTDYGPMWLGKCRENGKETWLDKGGFNS